MKKRVRVTRRRPTARWRSLGIASETVKGIGFDVELGPTGGVSAVNASVPKGHGPFSMEGVVVDARPPQIEGPSFHWHEGPKGRVLGDHWNTEADGAAAVVTIDTPEGSPLADILGSSKVTLPGTYLDFHHETATSLIRD